MTDDKLFFFDWDGTLCSDRLWRSLRNGSSLITKTIDSLFSGGNNGLLKAWMLGRESSENINRFIAESANWPFEKLWNIFVSDCKSTYFDPLLRRQIQKLKKINKTVLITGNMDCFRRFVVPALELENCFDAIVISSEVGIFKDENNGQQFKRYVSFFDMTFGSSFLIDDSEKCCLVFEKNGGRAIKTSGPEYTKKIIAGFL